MNSKTEENYLKTIFKLSGQLKSNTSTGAIAIALGVNSASVTDMIKKLSDKKLVEYQKSKGVNLTPKGEKIALSIVRKHRLWELFLVEKLGFKWDEVHDIAEQLEHIQSDELINRLDHLLGKPKFDPHGDPIPDANGKFASSKSAPLSESKVKQTYIMTGVVDHSPLFLQYLDKLSLHLGVELVLVEEIPFDKSLHISIDKKQKIFVSHDVARNILVSQHGK